MKYQFSIQITKSGDKNSAATKAVVDCKTLFSSRGYQDYTVQVQESLGKMAYLITLAKALTRFFTVLHKGAIVGIQYPMLNNVFKYFMKAARLKKVQFFCIIHDIELLRLGGLDEAAVKREVSDLNHYDCLIVHNPAMQQWLQNKGLTKKMISLGLFDYLTNGKLPANDNLFANRVVFAGNLSKSNFIYKLSNVPSWQFEVYGPNYRTAAKQNNVNWKGEFSPDEIVTNLSGDFGLIWDGERIEDCDEVLGNYLRYNNPHKLSLYFAAGLPAIAPAHAAIAELIHNHKAGILIHSLQDLEKVKLSLDEYNILKENCLKLHAKITAGGYFLAALDKAEAYLQYG